MLADFSCLSLEISGEHLTELWEDLSIVFQARLCKGIIYVSFRNGKHQNALHCLGVYLSVIESVKSNFIPDPGSGMIRDGHPYAQDIAKKKIEDVVDGTYTASSKVSHKIVSVSFILI